MIDYSDMINLSYKYIIKEVKNKYQDLYNRLLEQIKVKYLDNNLIDDKINDYVIQMLNDIFNYYLYGNKEIPIDI